MKSAQLLQGKQVAEKYQLSLIKQCQAFQQRYQRFPTLAVILLGDDTASHIYVERKRQMCLHIGIQSQAYHLPTHTTEQDLLALIAKLNTDLHIDGILVQLPLPPQIATPKIIEAILPEKDVDGFHPYNLGRLAQGRPLLRPCTPYGIMQLLDHYAIELIGRHAVVVGASNIVGRPMALELINAGCTVTICHSRTRDLAAMVKQADVLISAIGKRHIIDSVWLKEGAIVIDVGIHREQNQVMGDIDFIAAQSRASWITPVPGGVGPMTVIMLMQNTLFAATLRQQKLAHVSPPA